MKNELAKIKPRLILFSVFLMVFYFVIPCYSVDFDCHLSLDNYFRDKWDRTQFEAYPALSTCSKVERNQYFWVYVFLTDYDLDNNGNAHVIYNLKIKDEKGNIVYDVPNILAIDRKLVKFIPMYFCEGMLKVDFEGKHPLGQYEIAIEMKDIVSNKTKTKTERIFLVDNIEGDKFNSIEEIEKWMDDYYVAPKPQNVLNAIKYLCSLKDKEKDRQASIMTYFASLLNDNKYLSNYLVEEYKACNDNYTKDFILDLFSRSNVNVDSFEATLPSDEQAKYKEYHERSFHFIVPS